MGEDLYLVQKMRQTEMKKEKKTTREGKIVDGDGSTAMVARLKVDSLWTRAQGLEGKREEAGGEIGRTVFPSSCVELCYIQHDRGMSPFSLPPSPIKNTTDAVVFCFCSCHPIVFVLFGKLFPSKKPKTQGGVIAMNSIRSAILIVAVVYYSGH